MDRERAGVWLAANRRAWEEADTPAVLGLFTSTPPTAPTPAPGP